MIARVWHGWASGADAEAYEDHFHSAVLPDLQRVTGYRGVHLLRRVDGGDVEVMTITFFESIDAIRAFAGDDYDLAVVSPRAGQLLSRFDERVAHYDVVVGQDGVAQR